MLHIPAAIVPARAARCLMPVRCWRIEAPTTFGSVGPWRLTDCQHAIAITEEDGSRQVYTPSQPVFVQPKKRQTGMRSNSAELHIAMDGMAGIDDSVLERGLLDGAQVTEFEVDGMRPWIRLRMFRWYVSNTPSGKGRAELQMVGVSSRLQETVGETITTTCQNEFGDALCSTGGVINGDPDFSFLDFEVGVPPAGFNLLRTMRIREASDTFPAAAKTDADWWAHGRIRFIDGPNAGVEAWIESNETPINAGSNWVVDIVLATPLAYAPVTGNDVTMRVGCSRTHAVCKAKFGNLASFRGHRDIAGSDIQQITPGAS